MYVASDTDIYHRQSFLLSVRPFLRPKPGKGSRSHLAEKPEQEVRTGMVQSADRDEVYFWGREVDVDWSRVAWVTIRDQV